MPLIKNIADIEQYIKTQWVQQNQDLLNEKARTILQKEANKFADYMREELRNSSGGYNHYTDRDRVDRTVRAIIVNQPVKTGDKWSIKISFDSGIANQPSFLDPDRYPDGYTPWLMETGWDVRKKIPFNTNLFSTYHPGTQYITKAVSRFYADNPYNLKLTISMHSDYATIG